MLLVHIMNCNTNIFLRFIYREQAGIEIIIQQNPVKRTPLVQKKSVCFIEIVLRQFDRKSEQSIPRHYVRLIEFYRVSVLKRFHCKIYSREGNNALLISVPNQSYFGQFLVKIPCMIYKKLFSVIKLELINDLTCYIVLYIR